MKSFILIAVLLFTSCSKQMKVVDRDDQNHTITVCGQKSDDIHEWRRFVRTSCDTIDVAAIDRLPNRELAGVQSDSNWCFVFRCGK